MRNNATRFRPELECLEDRTAPSVTPGVYNPATATFYLRDSNNNNGPPDATIRFGDVGWVGLAGDWDGNGTTTIGAYDPDTAKFYLRNASNNNGPPDHIFQFGEPGWSPLAGDWDGDGVDTFGAYDPETATFYLRNANDNNGPPSNIFRFGGIGWVPMAGDWNNDGMDTFGAFDPVNHFWLGRDSNDNLGPPTAGANLVVTINGQVFFIGGVNAVPFGWEWGFDPSSPLRRFGMYDPTGGIFTRIVDTSGPVPRLESFQFGGAFWQPLSGDWNGSGS